MTPSSVSRQTASSHGGWGLRLRRRYWESRALGVELRRLLDAENRDFLRHVMRDQWRFTTGSVRPVRGDTERRARAAVEWLLQAQQRAADGGMPLGYFPCDGVYRGWLPSYPETTGYIITSLLAYERSFGERSAREAALRMARWEVAIQMPSGAVQGGPVCAPELRTPAAFNTGMVLDGWCSALEATGDDVFLQAARRAAHFLAGDLDERGYFRTNGAYVSGAEIKTYTCLCAWSMYRYGALADDVRCRELAVKATDAALAQQQPNGWFRHNCLNRSDTPLTHTIGYTLQGLLEVGLLTEREEYVRAVRRSVDAVCERIDARGLLPARLDALWRPAAGSSCLTGNAQIAIVCYRLHEHTGVEHYRSAADQLVDTLKALQSLDCDQPALRGAIAGSFPLLGGYMRAGYPNWATKYFLDALLLQMRSRS